MIRQLARGAINWLLRDGHSDFGNPGAVQREQENWLWLVRTRSQGNTAPMETRDLAYSSTKGERPADLKERWRMAQAIRNLAEDDVDVHALSVRVTHLLEPPSSLQHPDIVRRALETLNSM